MLAVCLRSLRLAPLLLPMKTVSNGMRRLVCFGAAIFCVASSFPVIAHGQEDADNPLHLIAPTARLSIAEKHEPVIRRDAEADPVADANADAHADIDAGEVPATSSETSITPESGSSKSKNAILELLKTAKESDALTDENRASVVGLLEKALESLSVTEHVTQQRAKVLAEIAAVPTQLEKLKVQLKHPVEPTPNPAFASLTLEQVEQRHNEVATELELARQALRDHQSREIALTDSRKQSQQRINDLGEQRDKVRSQLEGDPPEGLSEMFLKARRRDLKARLARFEAEEQLLKAQVELAKASVELQPLQNDLDRREIAQLEEEEKVWQQALSDKREAESKRQIAEAQRKVSEASDPVILKLAKENAELARTRSDYAGKMQYVTEELGRIRESFDEQETAFNKIRKRVEDIGMTEAIGHLLRTHQRNLLDDRPLRIQAKELEEELPKIELLVAETHEQREAMWDLDQLTKQYVNRLTSKNSEEAAYAKVYELLSARRQYLADLYADLQTYQMNLADLHIQLQNTVAITDEHRSYIGEHILWIRSGDTVSWRDVEASELAIRELLAPQRWIQVVHDVGHYLQRHLIIWLLILTLIVVGMVMSDRVKDRITTIGETKPVTSAYRFLPTLEVAAESLAVAVFLPGLMFLLSRYLTRFPEASFLETAIGVGLRWTSLMWLGLSVLQQVTRKGGLAEAHFGWHPNNVRVIRQNLSLLTTCGLPAVFVVMIIGTFRDGDYVSSLGRLSFMAGMSVMALFTHRLLDPYRSSNGVWAKRDVWLYRIRHVLHACCVMVPVSLATLAAMGYVFSAHQLAFRAQLSLWLVMGVVLSQAMLGRYLRIARRTAAMRHMQHRRSEKAENQDAEIPIENEIDFRSIDNQVQRLLRGGTVVALLLGVSFIWADMVPALKILDRVELWQIESNDLGPNSTSDPLRWITLADVLMSAAALLATVMAARNVPGLLNITVFERLPIDYGTRYALTAVTRYLISLIGIVLAFQYVGVTWRSVQWLVAAVTVGLGFGLQEIFANFVSGLIIFTERPVRVGDMVTVGNVTGKVTRVQIRATTITDFDRRELVVPNKRFITEDVINWTLSDPISRLVLSVGISYDCAPDVACAELLRIASEHALVLKEPEPTAIFVGFGDSTLNLELRVFMVGRDNAYLLQNELNLAINRVFKQANIEIAYPQRDLRIRSVDQAVLAEGFLQKKAA